MTTHPQTQITVALHDEAAQDPALVGVKAANLAAALRAGLPVPDGVVLTTAAHRRAIEGAAPRAADPQLRAALEQIIDATGGTALAVRSSCVAEDLPGASYAGQYETVLQVRGLRALDDAVRTCWASAHSERAKAYHGSRAGSDVESDSDVMAVLVQPMIQAVAAGVAFSADPVTGARDEVVVDAVPGLGDRLVAGEITPEHWVVSADGAELRSGASGALDAARACRVAALCRRTERHFGTPQDIEWALAGDDLHLLQARPITSLPTQQVEPVPIAIVEPEGFWEHDRSHFPKPNVPFDSVLPALLERAVERWVTEFGYLFDGLELRDVGGWMYQRVRPMGGREAPALPAWLMWVLVRTVPTTRRRLALAREAVRTDKPGRFIERWYDVWQPELETSIDELRTVDLASLDDGDLLAHHAQLLQLTARGFEIHTVLHGAMAPILFELSTTCERLLGWSLEESLELVSGTSYKSTEPAVRLGDLAELAHAHPAILQVNRSPEDGLVDRLRQVDPAFATSFEDYLNRYGTRALGQSITEPTLAELPSLLLTLVEDQLVTGARTEQAEERNRAAREHKTAIAREALRGNPQGAAEFERALARALRAYPVREDNEFFTFGAPFALLRYGVLELGRRLAARGVLAAPDDVAFLHLEEAHRALTAPTDLRAVVSHRQGQYLWATQHPGPSTFGTSTPPPASLDFLPADARLPMEAMLWSLEAIEAVGASGGSQSDPRSISGTPASPGSYTGPVRVVLDESEFGKLRAGDVLVCPITSPVWSVLFASIGALVTDTGGILSHPAIIAREYRIPAVVATGQATSVLHDGDTVTVDGSTGLVTRAGGTGRG